jgi:sulfite dehydrogenase (cytochrome) subunit B
MKLAFLAIFLIIGTASVVLGDEQPVALKNGPGQEVVENNCAACHSLDYPRTNSIFLDRKGWQAEVDKMIKVYGAEIAPQDAAAIIEYLTKNYGAGS